MEITATELKTNMGKYLSIAKHQDIFITKNGKKVATLTGPQQKKVEMVKSLFGIIPDDGSTLEQTRVERLSRYENTD